MSSRISIPQMIFIFITLILHTCRGQTCYPQTWQSGSWVEGFSNSNPLVRTYTTNEYSTQTYIGTTASGVPTQYECLGTGASNNLQFNVRRQKTFTGDIACESGVFTNNAIFMFSVPVSSTSQSLCPAALQGTNKAQWLPKRDPNSGQTPQGTCPFSDGVYRATYANSNQGEQCLGDASSTITVSGGTMTTNLCNTNLNSYENPLKGATIKCISSLQGSFLDSQDNGLIVLLQNADTARFYCARYGVKGTKHHLSLSIINSNTPYCYQGAKFDSYATNSLLLTLEKPCSVLPQFGPGSNIRWFYEYTPGLYYSQSFETDAQLTKWRANSVIESLNCVDHYSSKDMNYYLMQLGPTSYCYEINYVNENIIIQRFISTVTSQVKDCPNILSTISSMSVLTKYSSSQTFSLTPKKCPFYDGSYHVLYANNTVHDLCKGYQNSTADIATDTISVRTCTPTNFYTAPYYSDWTCYGNWRQDMTSFSSPSGGSDYLLLGYKDPTQANRLTFYCARFQVKINSAGYVQTYISLDVNDPNKVTCDMTKDHISKGNVTGNEFRAFLFIRLYPVTTTRPEPSTTTTTLAPSSSTSSTSTTTTASSSTASTSTATTTTTQPQCTKVCQNSGTCQFQGNLQICACSPGYTGSNCEVAMVAGLCSQEIYWNNQTKDCVDTTNPDYFLAICMPGFEGGLCQANIDDCAEPPGSSPHCSNGGTCQDMVNDWQCVCARSWTGKTCDTWADEDSNNLAIIIGLIVGLAGVILLIVIVAVILCYYRDKESEREKLADNDFQSDGSIMVTTSKAWYPDYKTDVTQLNDGVIY